MTDELPVERTRRIERIAPMDTKKVMPNDEFVRSFESPWRFPNRAAVAIHEQYSQSIFCDACVEERPNGSVNAFRMFVEREKDLLGNFPAILKLTCMSCGAVEQAPSKIPLNEEQPTYENLYERYSKERQQSALNEQRLQQLQAMKHAQHAGAYGQGFDQMQQQMGQARDAMNAIMGLAPMLSGGFGGAGGASSALGNKVEKPKTATEVHIRVEQEIAQLREMERRGAPDGMIEKMRNRIVRLIGYTP